MATPRSHAITTFQNGRTEIHAPETAYDPLNKAEHYGVLSQVVCKAISDYIENDYDPELYLQAPSTLRLKDVFQQQIGEATLGALSSDEFRDHFNSLHTSQTARHALNERGEWSTVEDDVMAGVTTSANSFYSIFEMLTRSHGANIAALPQNWTIADELAKLERHQFITYSNTYLASSDSWAAAADHFMNSPKGGVEFIPHFPGNATVSVDAPSLKLWHELTGLSLELEEGQTEIHINDIPVPAAKIGCIITFDNKTMMSLWQLYAAHAHHIVTRSPIASAGDSEASRRQTAEQSQQLYRQLAQSIPSAHLERPTHQSDH